MKKISNYVAILIMACLLQSSVPSTCSANDAPANMAAGLIMQLLSFEKNTASKEGELVIHVIGSKEIAEELNRSIGEKIAKRTLSKVTESNSLPEGSIDVLVISDEKIIEDALAFTRNAHIISITNKPELVEKGVSLGIGMNETGGQSITVNMAASKEEGLDWKPVILKIAKAVK